MCIVVNRVLGNLELCTNDTLSRLREVWNLGAFGHYENNFWGYICTLTSLNASCESGLILYRALCFAFLHLAFF